MAASGEPPAKAPRTADDGSCRDLDKRLEEEDAAIAELEAQLKKRQEARSVLLQERQKSLQEDAGFLNAIRRSFLPDTTTLLMLQKWNTPTVFNGWEQITKNPNYGRECFNLEPLTDHMPQMGSMVGFAVTVKIRPGDKEVPAKLGAGRHKFREHVAALPPHLPKIIVVQDEDKPYIFGSMWGEVNATFFRSVGAVGCIVDGGVRDLDEMTTCGLRAMSRGVCIGHSFGGIPVAWDVPVSVFGVQVRPGQLVHADKHGFLVVPEEDEERLLEATEFMDLLERKHTIVPGKEGTGSSVATITKAMGEAMNAFGREKTEKYGSYVHRFGPAA